MQLEAGMDFRRPEYRREVFLRFYSWTLQHQSHPGGVYYALPYLAQCGAWDPEQRAWAAFIQGNTQNPVTTALIMDAAPRVEQAADAVVFWNRHYRDLQWDTDRRYHKARFGDAVNGYLDLVGTTGKAGLDYWGRCSTWAEHWSAALALPYMGRLSAWSFLEYLKILHVTSSDADTLLLHDRTGSRSHRNGLCLVLGMDDWIWWDTNPAFSGHYTPGVLGELDASGALLLQEAVVRSGHHPDAGYLTLESALCTYKSWHRPNRRYPGVYNDLLHDRIRHGEVKFGQRFSSLWQARMQALPPRLRLEDQPGDPGCVPVKQNWYRTRGQVINMTEDWPCFSNDFELAVAAGSFGRREHKWI